MVEHARLVAADDEEHDGNERHGIVRDIGLVVPVAALEERQQRYRLVGCHFCQGGGWWGLGWVRFLLMLLMLSRDGHGRDVREDRVDARWNMGMWNEEGGTARCHV